MKAKQRKGITPVVATIALVGITVAATGTYYVVVSDALESQQRNVATDIEELNIESCWREDMKTHLLIRNANEEPINSSTFNLKKNDKIIRNFTTEPSYVEPEETFEIVINRQEIVQKNDTLLIDYQGTGFAKTCDKIEGATINDAISEGGGIVRKIKVIESINPKSSNLCIGSGCGKDVGNKPTSFDPNDPINRRGDSVNGSLSTRAIVTQGSVCMGSGCSVMTGSTGGLLSNQTNEMTGTLIVDNVTSSSSLCIGGSC